MIIRVGDLVVWIVDLGAGVIAVEFYHVARGVFLNFLRGELVCGSKVRVERTRGLIDLQHTLGWGRSEQSQGPGQ